ncbi:MAG: type IV pili twitching motility protein PilT [Bdellovibrionales bacterium CG10_big_fil_rev_8_21_14_0_10_45_34]|nr:MAG: type IV pili twitching motility protein PilT [Bdellovibrionales bacterium CG10_big_fil_rev_8_21_14_0_10_45_34]
MLSLRQLLKAVIDQGATDLHISAGAAPALRINGRLVKIKYRELEPNETKEICYSILSDHQKHKFEELKELDFAFGLKNSSRFRANYFYSNKAVAAAFRRIPFQVPTTEELKLPRVISDLVKHSNGLILVTGPTGSGKSTTLASLIDRINATYHGHILTIEDPVEYRHQHKNCIVNQRELGVDTLSYAAALRGALREDPDYCLIGELRDAEVLEEALKLAETGHLCFATLHTNSALQTVSRVVSMYPVSQQDRVRGVLSLVLQGVVSQQLLPGKDGGLCLALEVLTLTPAIRHLIRENKLHQIYSHMQTGQSKTGMITMNQSLLELVMRRKIEIKTAFEATQDIEELNQMLKKVGL